VSAIDQSNLPAKEDPMPRIIVTADPISSRLTDQTPVLLDEHVHSVHLSTGHAAAQLVERIAWAISDAEDAERADGTRPDRPARRDRQARSRGSATRPRVRLAVRA
jgi:hypothetical protein